MPLDNQGYELQVGDSVAFATLSYKRAHLRVGWIVGFTTRTYAGKEYEEAQIQYIQDGAKRGLTKPVDQVVRVVQ